MAKSTTRAKKVVKRWHRARKGGICRYCGRRQKRGNPTCQFIGGPDQIPAKFRPCRRTGAFKTLGSPRATRVRLHPVVEKAVRP